MVKTYEPEVLTVGDTWTWTKDVPDYRPEDSWVLSYEFNNATDTFSTTATDNGDGTFLVNIPAATTATYNAGFYNWQALVTKAPDRFTVDFGSTDVKPNPAAGPLDNRSHARKVLDAINALLEGKALAGDQLSYQLEGRSLTRMSPEELLSWRSAYERMVDREEAAERARKGLPTGNKILVRLQ